jgi:hypothetical protein
LVRCNLDIFQLSKHVLLHRFVHRAEQAACGPSPLISAGLSN